MGRAWAHISPEGEKTILKVGRHTLLTSSDSLLLPTFWVAFCLLKGYDYCHHHGYSWWANLALGFMFCLMSCQLVFLLVVRDIHRRRMKATG